MKRLQMFRKSISLVLTALILTLSGCGIQNESSHTSSAESFISEDSNAYKSGDLPNADVEDDLSGKKMINLAFSEAESYWAAKQVDDINHCLIKQGSEYALNIISVSNSDNIKSYQAQVSKLIESGVQVDLIFTGVSGSEDSANSYTTFTRANLLEPLTGYLESENGKDFYNKYPQKIWDTMKQSGDIYVVNLSSSLMFTEQIMMNEQLMEKYDITHDDLTGKQLWEMLDIFEKVAQGEVKKNGDEIVLLADEGFSRVHLYEREAISAGVFIRYSDKKVVFTLDDEDYLKHLRAIYDISKLGNVVSASKIIGKECDLVFSLRTAYPKFSEFTKHAYTDINGQPLPFVEVGSSSVHYQQNISFGTGICTASENKDGAFWMLTQIYSNPEIVDIIAYGIQGKDYEIVDGKSNVENGVLFIFLGNLYHSLPSMLDKPNKAEIIEKLIENSISNPFTGFYFDSTNVMSQIADTDAILSELDKLYTPEDESIDPIPDFDAFIADLRSRCEAAGVYDIVDEANRQLAQWQGGRK